MQQRDDRTGSRPTWQIRVLLLRFRIKARQVARNPKTGQALAKHQSDDGRGRITPDNPLEGVRTGLSVQRDGGVKGGNLG